MTLKGLIPLHPPLPTPSLLSFSERQKQGDILSCDGNCSSYPGIPLWATVAAMTVGGNQRCVQAFWSLGPLGTVAHVKQYINETSKYWMVMAKLL